MVCIMGKRNILLTLFFVGLLSSCFAQEKKDVTEEVSLTRKAIVIMNKDVRLDKEQVFEGKYLQNETDMAYRNQAKEKALFDFARKYKTSIIVDPFIIVKKKKGYFMVKVVGYPMKISVPEMHKIGKEGFTIDRRAFPQEKKAEPKNHQ